MQFPIPSVFGVLPDMHGSQPVFLLLVLIIQIFEATTCRTVKPYHVCSIS